ncbi:mycofactocin biosynthesis glycosyltransferase MftF [Frankia sp. AgB32]|uniref:mycofactocin biosynthesis glycosyltransferase MftF n=1 Tax=Frankia sp. AgB32 TaxID=631119 RepID=UPI00200C8B25|nr:mycofactocin biosynthesis glycosyltransferase MftF [Frankia sp. AgB32]MCK9898210.1 mycofactocin biosynthesis glycosyltransferase MftF [Frankia sp. AgB32]
MVIPLPASFRVWCDPELTTLAPASVPGTATGGAVLLGGSPLRLMTLSAAGLRVLGALRAGHTVGAAGPGAGLLARRLADAGLLHPLPPRQPPQPAALTAVIPARDGAARIGPLVAALRGSCAEVIVVDDGSVDDTAAVAERAGARVIRHAHPRGPAAARTTGARAARTDLIAFCDCDVLPAADWLDRLRAHLADPAVAAAAPRVASPTTTAVRAGLRDRYEAGRSPLDLGSRPAAARAGSRVAYVPSAALLIRREHATFDPALRYGEDVDLVWRLLAAGHTVRYEPAAVVRHLPRDSWPAWLRQRYGYGSSAAVLSRRHPGLLRPARGPAGAVLVALALAARHDRVGTLALGTVAVTSVAVTGRRLAGQLGGVDRPAVAVLGLTARVRRRGLLAAAEGARRTWLPLLACAGTPGRLVLAAAALPLVGDWWTRRPEVGLLPYVMLRAADDAAYCAGVWAGCLAGATVEPLLPPLPNRSRRRRSTPAM